MYNSISLLRKCSLCVLKVLLVCTLATSNPIRCYYGDKRETHCITDNKLGWCASLTVNFRDRNDKVYIERSKYSCASNDLYDHPFWCDETRNDNTYLKAGTCRTHTFTMANNGTTVSGIYCCCQKEFCNSVDAKQWLENGFPPTINDAATTASPTYTTILTYKLHNNITVSPPVVHTVAVTPSSPLPSSPSPVPSPPPPAPSPPSRSTPSPSPPSRWTPSPSPSPLSPSPSSISIDHSDFPLPDIPPKLFQAISAATGIASSTKILKKNYTMLPFPIPGPLPMDEDNDIIVDQLPPFTVPKGGLDKKGTTSYQKFSKWWLIGGGALLVILLVLSLIFIVLLCYWQRALCFKPRFDIEHNPSYESPPRVAKMLVTDTTGYPARVWFHDDQRPNSITISDIASSHSASSSGNTLRRLPINGFGTGKSML